MGKSIIRVFLLIAGLFFLSQKAAAMEIPVLKDVTVASAIEYDPSTGLYTFTYSLSNPETNTGQISIVEIDISREAQGMELSAEGLIVQKGLDADGVMLTSTFEEVIARYGTLLRKEVIPAGMEPPMGWGGGISVMGTALWGSDEKKYRIMPGQSLTGFAIISYGVPTIREMLIHPKWVYVTEGNISDEESAYADKVEEELTVRTKTIGPTAPPVTLVPADFVDNIISMKHEAYSLGWITSEGVETSLDAKLDSAKKKLEQGNNNAAKQVLEAFVNEVEAQGCATYDDCPEGKHLKPEAYALLKYNAKYLIDNLGN